MATYRVGFDDMEWQSPAAGVRFKAYRQDGRRLRLVEFGLGFRELDWCTGGHVGMVLAGRGEIDFDGTVVPFGPGDGVFIPPGAEHRHKLRVLQEPMRVVLVEEVS